MLLLSVIIISTITQFSIRLMNQERPLAFA